MRVEAVARTPLAPVGPARGSVEPTISRVLRPAAGTADRSTTDRPAIDVVELSVGAPAPVRIDLTDSAVPAAPRQEVAPVGSRPDPRIQAIVAVAERFTGHRVSLLGTDPDRGVPVAVDLARRAPDPVVDRPKAPTDPAPAGWGIALDQVRADADLATIDVAATAYVPAADGGLAVFGMQISMTRVVADGPMRTYTPSTVTEAGLDDDGGGLHLWAHLEEPIVAAPDGAIAFEAHLGDGVDRLQVVASASVIATRRGDLEIDGFDSDGDGWLDGNDLPFDFLTVDGGAMPTPTKVAGDSGRRLDAAV